MNDWIELRGKTALVTGGARRLGAAVCGGLAAQGVNLVVHCNTSAAEAEQTAARARGAGVEAAVVQGDIADAAAAPALMAAAIERAGPIDFLVNGAGIFPEDTWATASAASVQANLEANAFGPFALARAFAAQDRPGAVVNFLDTMIADYDRRHFSYHLSKRLFHTLTRILAVELAPGVRVNAVAPGLTLAPEGKDESYLAGLAHSNLLEDYGSPRSTVETVLFLLRSGFVTGQTIYVDGGRNLRGRMYD